MLASQKHIICRLLAALCLTAVMLTVSCGEMKSEDSDLQKETPLDSASRTWSEYYTRAQHDVLVKDAGRFLDRAIASNDSVSVFASSIYIAQSYLFMDERDSVKIFADLADRYRNDSSDRRYVALLYNVRGIYEIKFDFNYSKALQCFREVYELSCESDNIPLQILSLSNIVSIYYIRGDRHGLGYAEQAYKLMDRLGDAHNRCLFEAPVYLSVARMEFLSEDCVSAVSFLSKADSLISSYDMINLKSSATLLHGDIYSLAGDFEKADSCYAEALESATEDDLGILTQIYLNYGRLNEETGELGRAIRLYEQGLGVSKENHNMLFRSELLSRLTRLYSMTGDLELSKRYGDEYNNYVDSISLKRLEQDFNALEMSYRDMEYRYSLQSKELEIMRTKRNMLVLCGIIIFIVIVSVSIYIVYRRQREMYRRLFENHQKYVQRINSSMVARADDDSDNMDRELYLKADSLMQNERIYVQKDMTLDKLAKMMNTNRTYLSKAINKYSGMSFSSYLNMYRIKEATRIISDAGKDILIKQLSDDLGYSSVSVFSKAFQKETGLSPSKYRKEVISGAKSVDDL